MNKKSRIIIIIASISLISAFFFPLWDIALEAPQYPEGLGMKIWINKISGDLQTINGLNHYIGMKKIEPDSIKELTIMPYIVGLLTIAGIITGFLGRKKILMAWVILFIIAGITGGVDFYMWEYDYGHNLNEEAAIKIPGMTYQPPIIGSKQLLNFTAHSYPETAGYILILSGLVSAAIFFFETFGGKTLKKKEIKIEKEKGVYHVLSPVNNRVLVQQ
ncbi:MAG TPA: hypothetical protein VGK25_13990 [Ignavibacteria bacterium]|jgi:hypothetical protein